MVLFKPTIFSMFYLQNYTKYYLPKQLLLATICYSNIFNLIKRKFPYLEVVTLLNRHLARFRFPSNSRKYNDRLLADHLPRFHSFSPPIFLLAHIMRILENRLKDTIGSGNEDDLDYLIPMQLYVI